MTAPPKLEYLTICYRLCDEDCDDVADAQQKDDSGGRYQLFSECPRTGGAHR